MWYKCNDVGNLDEDSLGLQLHDIIFIPLQAKRVGEFIKISHKKISPTLILGTLGCLSLCNSVTLWPINPHLSQQPAMGLCQNFKQTTNNNSTATPTKTNHGGRRVELPFQFMHSLRPPTHIRNQPFQFDNSSFYIVLFWLNILKYLANCKTSFLAICIFLVLSLSFSLFDND